MAKLKPKDIEAEVRDVLNRVTLQDGAPPYLTAYQILQRLPDATKAKLLGDRGPSGKDAASPYTSVTVVSQAAQMVVGDAPAVWLDTSGLGVDVTGDEATLAGSRVCRLYKLAPVTDTSSTPTVIEGGG